MAAIFGRFLSCDVDKQVGHYKAYNNLVTPECQLDVLGYCQVD